MRRKEKRKRRNPGEIDYWESTSDILVSLLLVMLLVMLLLGLYLVYNPNLIIGDPWPGDNSSSEVESEGIDDEGEGNDDEEGDGDEAGSEETPTPTPTPTITPTPTPVPAAGTGPGDEPDEGIKSAVYVMLVDAQTGRTVKEEGVTFELYSEDNGLQILNTYYPEKITYRDYETTDSGTFYLPEKIYQGGYYLRELTEASGYDIAEDQYFVIDRLYDWPEPYLVTVPVEPSQNVIRIHMQDKKSGLPLGGSSFDIVAAEDIITLDGTIRHKLGETVGEIICDEEGNGVSQELYLGKYKLRQSVIPEYYASLEEEVKADVEKKGESDPASVMIQSEKTSIEVSVYDELYDSIALEGVTFEIGGGGKVWTEKTNSRGQFLLEDLEKGVSYHIHQSEPLGDYLPDTADHVLTVGNNGRIAQEAHASLNLTNRMIRVTISLQDALLGSQITDANLALYNSSNELIRTWTTTGLAVTMNDLREGSYYVIKDGDTQKKYMLNVANTAELQELSIILFTWRSVVVAVVALLVVIFVIVVLVVLGRSIHAKRKAKKELEQEKLEAFKAEEKVDKEQ